jgi:hypothetical protein
VPLLWLLRCLLLLACCTTGAAAWAQAAHPAAAAADGRIDLHGHDLATQGNAPLAGAWRFHPRRFIDPAAAPPEGARPLAVPGPWNDALGGAEGWGSYELTVDCERSTGSALLLPAQHSAALVRQRPAGVPAGPPGRARRR